MTDLTLEAALAHSRPLTGWLEEDEAATLYRHAADLGALGPILEIGSFHGKSTVVLATAAKSVGARIYAVDPHEGINYWQDDFGPMPELGPTLDAFRHNLRTAGVADAVIEVVMTSREAFDHLREVESFGLVFIDGNHGYEHVRRDFDQWSQRLAADGVLAFHDSDTQMPGPRRVIAQVRERDDFAYIGRVAQLTSFRKIR